MTLTTLIFGLLMLSAPDMQSNQRDRNVETCLSGRYPATSTERQDEVKKVSAVVNSEQQQRTLRIFAVAASTALRIAIDPNSRPERRRQASHAAYYNTRWAAHYYFTFIAPQDRP
jgi:hypothetical protein